MVICPTDTYSAGDQEKDSHVPVSYFLSQATLPIPLSQLIVKHCQSRNTCNTRKQHSLSEEQEQFSLGAEGFPSEHGQVLQGHA